MLLTTFLIIIGAPFAIRWVYWHGWRHGEKEGWVSGWRSAMREIRRRMKDHMSWLPLE